jgi:SAM-dependent methyltransferase
MDGFDRTTYGDAFADVYDDWYRGISDPESTVATLLDLAGGGPVLELGVGTGRLAVPLAIAGRAVGVSVTGVDASAAMLARLAERDPERLVRAIEGDMVADLPDETFSLAYVAYNTIFNLVGDAEQAACFAAIAARLRPGGRFVVEAFVPEDPPRDGDDVSVRSLSADRVVLSITVHDAVRQLAEGQFVELTERGGVRLRPWSIRYATPDQLDEMAGVQGLDREFRWEGFERREFDELSARHVTVYRKR